LGGYQEPETNPLLLPWRFLGLINVVFKKKSIEPDLIYDHGYFFKKELGFAIKPWLFKIK